MRKTPFSYGVPAAWPKIYLSIKPQTNILKDVNLEGKSYVPGPSISAYMIEKSSSFTPTLIPSGGDSSRFFSSFASCFITLGGRFSFVAFKKDRGETI